MNTRCAKCKKKTAVTFACVCQHQFCTACRLPEIHACDPPKKKVELVKVVAEKIDKI
jgi:predicted nucleic acid binding AN1-type Zn finger protein